MFAVQMNNRACLFVILLLSILSEGAADCTDSIICCNKLNEILIIAGVIAVCFFFFIQCIVIVCLASKLSKVQKRLDVMSLSRGSHKLGSSYPVLPYHENALEEKEEPNGNPRARRISGAVPSVGGPIRANPITIFDNPQSKDQEIWGLY
ncbi:unnamed protein product [Pocillopora meandrina]|uniref:Uncharacterized protein n=1 Tax=Pocillopora meandrina TaxID=46732 RepID=A0AAU9XVK8_9CNID|nr:unnamed protein product [Pocillopora meandrina]